MIMFTYTSLDLGEDRELFCARTRKSEEIPWALGRI